MIILVAAAILAIPGRAHAGQLLVGTFNGNVLRYDAGTGAFLGEFIAAGTGGLMYSWDFALGPDGHLYVANRNFRNPSGAGNILRFNRWTGAFIDVFVPALSGGLRVPTGLAFGPDDHLYVADAYYGVVRRYNARTGVFIDNLPKPDSPYPIYPNQPPPKARVNDVAFGPDNTLYLSTDRGIARYNIFTNTFPGFVFSSSNLFDLAISPNGGVVCVVLDTVIICMELQADRTGAWLDIIPKAFGGLAFGPEGSLYAPTLSSAGASVLRVDVDNREHDLLVLHGSGGLRAARGIIYLSDQPRATDLAVTAAPHPHPGPVNIGTLVWNWVNVSNLGAVPASNVGVTITAETNGTAVIRDVYSSAGWNCVISGLQLNCTQLGPLPAGQTDWIGHFVHVVDNLTAQVMSTVTVSSDGDDSNPLNNTAQWQVGAP